MITYITKEMLEESVKSDSDPALSKAVIFYQHMIKWKWYKNDTEEKYTSWINSITEANKSIKKIIYLKNGKIRTNVVNRCNDELYKSYLDGVKAASAELNINNKLLLKNDNNEVYNDFNDIRSICNDIYLRDWLEKYSSERYKYMIDRWFNNK